VWCWYEFSNAILPFTGFKLHPNKASSPSAADVMEDANAEQARHHNTRPTVLFAFA